MKLGPVHHVAIAVHDLSRAVTFYSEVFGLPVLRRWPAADGAGERSVWLDLGGDAFLALERCDAEPRPRPFAEVHAGLHLLALRIGDGERARWRDRLREHGVPVVHETQFTLYVQDPEGNRVGLSHWPTPRAEHDDDADAR